MAPGRGSLAVFCHRGLALGVVLVLSCLGCLNATSDEPIPDKVGAEVHLTKKERGILKKLECPMCKAVLREMHTEVVKHKMTGGGWGSESQVWETSNAICLAMLQKYRLDLATQKLERKAEDEDDDDLIARSGGNPADAMRSMLVLKMGCQQWVEDYGGDTSGYIYKAVKESSNTADGAAQDFCIRSVNLCGSGKKEKKKKDQKKEQERRQKREAMIKEDDKKEAAAKEEDPFKSLPEDSKFGLQRMLEMARDDPLHYMEDDGKERIRVARQDLRCDVCRAVLEDVNAAVAKRPKTMQREFDILPFSEGACDGGKDLSVPSYFGVEPPPLPPVWTDSVRPHLSKKLKRWTLRPMSKKLGKERRKWRDLTVDGRHKPPPGTEGEQDMMLTLTCKDVLEPERITEALFKERAKCADAPKSSCDAVLLSAQAVCRTGDGVACAYAGQAGPDGKSEEL